MTDIAISELRATRAYQSSQQQTAVSRAMQTAAPIDGADGVSETDIDTFSRGRRPAPVYLHATRDWGARYAGDVVFTRPSEYSPGFCEMAFRPADCAVLRGRPAPPVAIVTALRAMHAEAARTRTISERFANAPADFVASTLTLNEFVDAPPRLRQQLALVATRASEPARAHFVSNILALLTPANVSAQELADYRAYFSRLSIGLVCE